MVHKASSCSTSTPRAAVGNANPQAPPQICWIRNLGWKVAAASGALTSPPSDLGAHWSVLTIALTITSEHFPFFSSFFLHLPSPRICCSHTVSILVPHLSLASQKLPHSLNWILSFLFSSLSSAIKDSSLLPLVCYYLIEEQSW